MTGIEDIGSNDKPIIIYGAGIVGEALYNACVSRDIKVECFCDNNINKTKKPFCGREVVHTPTLKSRFNDAVFLISAADIRDAVAQLRGLGFTGWHAGSVLLRNFDIHKHLYSAPSDFVEYAVATAILCQDSFLSPEKVFLRSVDLITTERCSLKCRDCSNLMRYYKNPTDCDTVELMRAVDRFCEVVDEVNEFRVIGGEPFMNRDAHLIIKKLVEEPKVRTVTIYTNATIPLRDEQIDNMRNSKVLFIITDYGCLTPNLNGFVKVLETNKIAHYVAKAHGWTDCASIGRRGRTIAQQREIFGKCCAKNTFTLSNGRLYRCPYSANAARLKAIPDFNGDYINIFEEIALPAMKEKIRKFATEKEYLNSCDFCSGRSFDDPEIEPAVQVDKPIEYKRVG